LQDRHLNLQPQHRALGTRQQLEQSADLIPVGQSGDITTPGDYNFDGKTDIAIFRPSISLVHPLLRLSSRVFHQEATSPLNLINFTGSDNATPYHKNIAQKTLTTPTYCDDQA
jgi:hypothetical protein